MSAFPTKLMFGLEFVDSTTDAVAEALVTEVKRDCKILVITPNVDHIVTLKQSPALYETYQKSKLLLPDGMPIVWLSKLLPGSGLRSRISGTDFLYAICNNKYSQSVTIGLVGGLPGVAEKAKENLERQFSNIKVMGCYSPPFGFESDDTECKKIVGLCNQWKADILCICVGAPKQEIWAAKYLEQLDCKAILCIGGAIDMAAGIVNRALKFIQNIGMEWFWRLIQEPGRLWKRYLIKDSSFILYALCEIGDQWKKKLCKRARK